MTLRNRVTPFSTIEANPARGMFMGNRGCLHGEYKNLEVEETREKRWLVCALTFKGRKRVLMRPGIWLQKITTQEPAPDQIEVAIASFDEVLRCEREAPRPAGPPPA